MSEARQDKHSGHKLEQDFILSTDWRTLLARARAEWPELTDNDLASLDPADFSRGNYEGLVGRLRERYSLVEDDAQRKALVFLQRLRNDGPQAEPPVQPDERTS